MATVSFQAVGKSYGSAEVLHDISLHIPHREFVVLLGPSGCGKSTLLRMIAGLEDITSGIISVDDEPVNAVAAGDRGVAMVFQNYALYPHMSAYENMAFALRNQARPAVEIDQRVQRAAEILQIEELLRRRPKQMSGGQRQRVAIGRAIVREPKVFLFDEPLSNLDASLRVQMRVELARLHQQLEATMIYVTHDQTEAMTMADRIVVMNKGQIEQVGSPLDIYHRPSSLFVAGFIGSPRMNLLSGRVAAATPSSLRLALQGIEIDLEGEYAVQAGDVITFGVRPEAISVNAGGQTAISAKVDLVEHLGNLSLVYFTTRTGDRMVMEMSGAADFRLGGEHRLGFQTDAIHLFDASGAAVRPVKTSAGVLV